MANLAKIHRPAVKIMLEDNVERSMSYRLSAFAKMEQKFGSVDAAMEALEKGKIADIIFMLYLGLVWEDKTLTEEQVGDLIDIRCMEEVAEVMREALKMDAPLEESNNVVEITRDNDGEVDLPNA